MNIWSHFQLEHGSKKSKHVAESCKFVYRIFSNPTRTLFTVSEG